MFRRAIRACAFGRAASYSTFREGARGRGRRSNGSSLCSRAIWAEPRGGAGASAGRIGVGSGSATMTGAVPAF